MTVSTSPERATGTMSPEKPAVRVSRSERRHRRLGTVRRRWSVIAELLAVAASVVVGYYVLIGRARRLEVRAIADLLHVAGFHRISGALGSTLVIFRPNGETVSASLTPSCSSLMSVLALAALASSVLRRRRVHTFAAFVVAAIMLVAANMLRIGLSAVLGLWLGRPALLLFHDWVGTLWTFAATLAGFLLLVSLTLPTAERAEQDRAGRHTARRPNGWGRTGLGYRVPALDRSQRNHRPTLTGLAMRYLVPGAVRRALAKRREAHRIDYRIGHLSIDQRVGAVVDLAAPGLGVHTASLLAVATYETEAAVLNALANAVVTQQWEPVTSSDVGSLRLWARGWLMSHLIPPVGPLSGGEGPAIVEEMGKGVPAVPIPAVVRPLVPATGRPVVRPLVISESGIEGCSGGGRRLHTVAVTGAGGPAGIAVVRALVAAGHRVIALDADPLAAGLRLAAVAAVIPRADESGYAEGLMAVVEANGPDALICTVAEEYPALMSVIPSLDAAGCRTWLPEPEAAETCLDKQSFARCLRHAGVPHPPTASSARAARRLPGPWIVKPRRGRGSRDVTRVDDPNQLASVMASIPDAIAQSRLSGREFTADVLVDRDGQLITCVPRWRLETKAGISVRGMTFDSEEVTQTAAEALAAVGLTGPANVQGFVDTDGAVAIVEINPRFSGGLPLTLASGADVVGAYLEGICRPDVALRTMLFAPGVRMLRYFAEVFEDAASGLRLADPATLPEPEPMSGALSADMIYRRRLEVLQHGAATKNVQETCLLFGVSRSTFYRWRRRAARDGLASLKPKEPGQPLPPVAVA
jgi:exosortase/archaeosortase family protein